MPTLSALILPVKDDNDEIKMSKFDLPSGGGGMVPSAYCETEAATAAKTASCTDYTLTSNTYLHVLMKYANTVAGAITFNVNDKGAKPVYINGTISSNSNYSLPAGTYIVKYDGTNYYFRTDGNIPGTQKITVSNSKMIVTEY